METQKCSECDSSFVSCYHVDVGGVDYYDEYILHCKDCGNIKRSSQYGGSPNSDNWLTFCPYCGIDCHSHKGMPVGFMGFGKKYKPEYKPLFFFNCGSKEFCIATNNEKVFVVVYGYEEPKIKLELPVPHNNDNEGLVYETWDNASINFNIVESNEVITIIDILVFEQKGYWYYGGLDDSIPPASVVRKRLSVAYNGSNLPVVNMRTLFE